MRNVFAQIFLAVLALGVSNVSVGCEPTYNQVVAMHRRDRAIEESYVLKLFRTSDLVVVGKVADVRDSNSPLYYQDALITVERTLKGPTKKTVTVLMEKRKPAKDSHSDNSSLETLVECDAPYDPSQEAPYLLEGYRALVYIKNGVLVRANIFPVEPQPLWINTKSEIEFLDSHTPRAKDGG